MLKINCNAHIVSWLNTVREGQEIDYFDVQSRVATELAAPIDGVAMQHAAWHVALAAKEDADN